VTDHRGGRSAGELVGSLRLRQSPCSQAMLVCEGSQRFEETRSAGHQACLHLVLSVPLHLDGGWRDKRAVVVAAALDSFELTGSSGELPLAIQRDAVTGGRDLPTEGPDGAVTIGVDV
jgi:hypothetical protein